MDPRSFNYDDQVRHIEMVLGKIHDVRLQREIETLKNQQEVQRTYNDLIARITRRT